MTDDTTSLEHELRSLRDRVQHLEHREASRRRLLRRGGVLVAVSTLFLVGSVLAADGNCPNGLPFCFTADEPARASEVNHNFAQVKEWLEAKVGRPDAGVTVTSGLIRGSNSAGNLHLDAVNNGLYLNWFSGSGGVYFGNAAQGQAGRIATNGNLTLAGSINAAGSATLGANGGNVPFSCVVRSGSGYNIPCQAGEVAVGGGARCSSLYRITENSPWGGASDAQPWIEGQPARAWRVACQVWGNAGTYAAPQNGGFAICCRQ